MAYTDALNTFALRTALDGGGIGSNMIGSSAVDMVTPRDIGKAQKLWLVISASGAFTGTGSIQFNLLTGATDPLTTGDDVVLQTPVITAASVTEAKTLYVIALPIEGAVPYERYLQMSEVVTTSAVGGSINAYLTMTPPAWEALPEGNN